MLPVLAGSVEDPSLLRIPYDAWIVDPAIRDVYAPRSPARETFRFPCPHPATTESALDLIEALVEWVETITGRRCTEGALEKSLRAYIERDAGLRTLAARIEADPGFLAPDALRNVLRSGNFLPVESHAFLLMGILGENGPTAAPVEKVGDPFLFLARRIRRKSPQGDP
jgi:hypothetical protein